MSVEMVHELPLTCAGDVGTRKMPATDAQIHTVARAPQALAPKSEAGRHALAGPSWKGLDGEVTYGVAVKLDLHIGESYGHA